MSAGRCLTRRNLSMSDKLPTVTVGTPLRRRPPIAFSASDGRRRSDVPTSPPLLSRRHFLSNTATGLGSVALAWLLNRERSEERRVGKSVDLGGRRIIKKKK